MNDAPAGQILAGISAVYMTQNTVQRIDRSSASAGKSFGAEARLRNRQMIDIVKAKGVTHAGRYSVIVVLDTPPDEQCRAAFLISRKFSLLAVTRNRARRLFRETYRLLYSQLRPCWILMIPRRKIQTAKMQDVLAETRQILQGCGLCGAPTEQGAADLP